MTCVTISLSLYILSAIMKIRLSVSVYVNAYVTTLYGKSHQLGDRTIYIQQDFYLTKVAWTSGILLFIFKTDFRR
jgi:hypothetical protein